MLPIISAVGNLAADPQLGYANNGTPVLNFTIYCNGVANGNAKHIERVKSPCGARPPRACRPSSRRACP